MDIAKGRGYFHYSRGSSSARIALRLPHGFSWHSLRIWSIYARSDHASRAIRRGCSEETWPNYELRIPPHFLRLFWLQYAHRPFRLLALWAVTGLIILAAIVGKGAACAIAARIAGEPWRESVMIGTLMNARGLVELVILNIGLQRGVITPTLFTIMVLMAIITTIMVLPIFSFLYGRRAKDVAFAET